MKIIFGIILVLVFAFGGYLLVRIAGTEKVEKEPAIGVAPQANNVQIIDGKQIIEIKAKGGYLPRVSTAKAGIPTVLRINTSGTFDCSSQVRIPSMNISRSLPPSGVTEIDLGVLSPGELQGTCGMGMYPFEINAEN